MIYNNILELIGNTPMIKLNFEEENMGSVYLKLEKYNLSGSIKDRAALGMIEEAERQGILKKGDTIVEATSGNTGIALALIGTAKGYNVVIVMPETMSIERRELIKAYGAELVLTSGELGTKGALEEATRLVKEKSYIMLNQFKNIANPKKHYETTANEILKDLSKVDAFVAGVGTGGTVTGVARNLKEKLKDIKIFAVEPESSAVISGKPSGKHIIQGIGAGFIPENYDASLVDEVIKISDDETVEFFKKLKKMGIIQGISTAANVAVAYAVAKRLGKGSVVVTVSPDGVEKYLSIERLK